MTPTRTISELARLRRADAAKCYRLEVLPSIDEREVREAVRAHFPAPRRALWPANALRWIAAVRSGGELARATGNLTREGKTP